MVENALQPRIERLAAGRETIERLDRPRGELPVEIDLGLLSCRAALRTSLKTALRVISLEERSHKDKRMEPVEVDELTLMTTFMVRNQEALSFPTLSVVA